MISFDFFSYYFTALMLSGKKVTITKQEKKLGINTN
jgi:hypothetical protein